MEASVLLLLLNMLEIFSGLLAIGVLPALCKQKLSINVYIILFNVYI